MGGMEAIDPRYAALWARAQDVLGADDRVRSVALAGSVATGTADRWSDLDLAVVAHGDTYDALLADWPRWLAEITPTVFARTPVAPMIVNAVTAEGMTLDLVVHRDTPGRAVLDAPADHRTWRELALLWTVVVGGCLASAAMRRRRVARAEALGLVVPTRG